MLRHTTGYYLANNDQDTRAGQLYLGRKNIQHTVRYTELLSGRFKEFWRRRHETEFKAPLRTPLRHNYAVRSRLTMSKTVFLLNPSRWLISRYD